MGKVGGFILDLEGGVMLIQASYIWLDGAVPTQTIRAKTKIIPVTQAGLKKGLTLKNFPDWGFDGSSTNQAMGKDSDLILKPVHVFKDPILKQNNHLVLCEVMLPNGKPHPTNKRAKLAEVLNKTWKKHEPWVGFEQEYTFFDGSRPLGWPEKGYPAQQGPFYCGVGADEAFGRQIVEEHTQACLDAGICIAGINAEVMPGQWEFQVGYRGEPSDDLNPLTVCDHLWVARWLLYRIGERYNVSATLDPKPIKGDWNGAGKHTNFSTKSIRDPKQGKKAIDAAVSALKSKHKLHISHYGAGLEDRLTGDHETAHISKFSAGVADRSCSVRIPRAVAELGCGYIEDRRPGANANPYEVATLLIQTILNK